MTIRVGRAAATTTSRAPKRLYERREAVMRRIVEEYERSERRESTQEAAREHAVHEGGMLDRRPVRSAAARAS